MRLKPRKTKAGQGSYSLKGSKNDNSELLPLLKAPLTPSAAYFPKYKGTDKGSSKETSRLDAHQRDEFSLASCHLENNRIFHLELTQNFIYIHGDYYFQLVRGHSLLP